MKFAIVIFCLLFQVVRAQETSRYCILITEIMADPSPAVSLPPFEFIELCNVSKDPMDVFGWKVIAGTQVCIINRHLVVPPGAYLIVCGLNAASTLQSYGLVIGLSNFPSLDNDGETIQLLSPGNNTIHAVGYSSEWYGSEIKKQGGWSMEMMDRKLPCAGSENWKASSDMSGGTPGKLNAVNGVLKDDISPVLKRTYTIDSVHVVAIFEEPVDSGDASNHNNYRMDNLPVIVEARPLAPLFDMVELTLSTPLQRQRVYQLEVQNLRDCHGNRIGSPEKSKAGMPEPTDTFDLVINEILFNPPSGGFDYVELYNRSGKIADLRQLFLASKNVMGQMTQLTRLQNSSVLFFPGEYLVFTENSNWTLKQYLVKNPPQLLSVLSMPSLPDNEGRIVLMNDQGLIIDQVNYTEAWHFPLLVNAEGVALERVNYNSASQTSSNWSSASSTSGYGTPTYQNSQLAGTVNGSELFSINPSLFSPNQDGIQDYLFIEYNVGSSGFMGSIIIFDANGNRVKTLVNNLNLSARGIFKWDGLDDFNRESGSGIYIIYMEVFNLAGKRKKYKKAVTLARGN